MTSLPNSKVTGRSSLARHISSAVPLDSHKNSSRFQETMNENFHLQPHQSNTERKTANEYNEIMKGLEGIAPSERL
jgi:hypothetical protein